LWFPAGALDSPRRGTCQVAAGGVKWTLTVGGGGGACALPSVAAAVRADRTLW
jgi:hypothetical protein